VVLKAEIEALIVHLKIDAQEFDRLWLQTPLSTPSASVIPASARLPIGDLLNRLPRIGWELIEAVCGSLPSPIAQRLMLKLPKTGAHPVTDESTASPSSVVGVAYDLAVTHWDPQWERSWGEVLTHVPGQRT
jgi:hypothetical protein